MSFLQSLVTNVSSYFGEGSNTNTAYTVKKVSAADYAKATLVDGGDESGYFKLYKTVKPDGYDCILMLGTLGGKTFRCSVKQVLAKSQALFLLNFWHG